MKRFVRAVVALGLACAATPGLGQNVSDYSSIPEPLLFLVREPAVHRDLALTHAQQARLVAINERYDGELLSSRNVPPEEAQPRIANVLSGTREALDGLLDNRQRTRLGQLRYRVRGISLVLVPDAAAELGLTAEQRQRIEEILRATAAQVESLQQDVQSGKTSSQEATQLANTARRDEQIRVLEQLSEAQRSKLLTLIGPSFDLTRLGQVRFKAPEFSQTGQWINSEPQQLADLRGRVVVVHFWAFGCINCIRNYPWYRQWYDDFADRDVTIVGVHTPETEAERDIDRVRQKVEEESLRFPIVVDNDHAIWRAWGNSIWPTVYLIDRQGRLRYWWYGELNWQNAGGQRVMAQRIEELLAEGSNTRADASETSAGR